MGKCIFLWGKVQTDVENSNLETFESTLYMKSVGMSLRNLPPIMNHFEGNSTQHNGHRYKFNLLLPQIATKIMVIFKQFQVR